MSQENTPKPEPPIEKVIERIEKTEADLAEALEEKRRAEAKEEHDERELKEELKELEEIVHRDHPYPLKVNRQPHLWHEEKIKGAQIKELAKSPADWVVNQIVDGPGEDPEILDDQEVNLDEHAEPKGEKCFTTRKPKTSPGA